MTWKRSWWARFVLRGMLVVSGLAATVIVSAWSLVMHGNLIDRARFARTDDAVLVVDRHGTPLRRVRADGSDRRWAALGEISPNVVHAFVATEDARFFEHDGADLRAVARAAANDVLPWRRRSGASTITQQLVKLVYGRPHGAWDKPLEVLRALALERVFTKQEILEQYLNRVPFGDGIEGVARASETYFGRPVADLTVSEAAMLAGIPRAPTETEPRRHFERAVSRRNAVLARMRAAGFLDDASYRTALREPVVLATGLERPYAAPRFVDAVLRQWREGLIARQGDRLITSVDLPLQRRVESIVRASVDRFSPRGVTNGAAIVVHNPTGEVLAYVGAARDDATSRGAALDLLAAPRQPGSTLKPFVYELLFEHGGTAATVLDDIVAPMTGAHGDWFAPRDYDGQERGAVRARVALSSSLNLAALDAARRVGVDAIVSRLASLGVHGLAADPERYGPAIVLGGADVTPRDLAHAYVALARGGTAVPFSFEPVAVQRGVSVLHPEAARVAWDILSDGEARASAFGTNLVDLAGGSPFALKTGTSAGFHDAWAVAANDSVVVLVWLGDPDSRPLAAVSGFEAAAPTAARILAEAMRVPFVTDDVDTVRPQLPPPSEVEVCAWSGLRAGPRCTHTVRERFAPGTEPRETCHSHGARGENELPERFAGWVARTHPARVVATVPHSTASGEVHVIAPRSDAYLLVDPQQGLPTIPLRAHVDGASASRVRWEVDGVALAGSQWTVSTGTHRIVAIAGTVRSEPQEVRVVAAH